MCRLTVNVYSFTWADGARAVYQERNAHAASIKDAVMRSRVCFNVSKIWGARTQVNVRKLEFLVETRF